MPAGVARGCGWPWKLAGPWHSTTDRLNSGALELWDRAQKRSLRTIAPEFNRSVVLCHGPASFHGHPHPLATPAGTTRRSLSSYYYSNRVPPDATAQPPRSTQFLIWKPGERLREVARNVAPPFVWNALKRTFKR